MRNAKVRRRIAAGKLKLRIRDLRNLGPRSEQLLAAVGIRSADGLRRRGAVEAYLALRRVGATRSLNMLWAMAGALDPWPEGQDWRDVAAGDQRLPLLLAVDDPSVGETPAAGRRRRKGAGPAARAAAGAPDLGAALGAWAPGLPFEEGPGGLRDNARGGVEPDGDGRGGGPPDLPRRSGALAATPKTKSRPKAGS
jgi:DNA transformation protein and related proteins